MAATSWQGYETAAHSVTRIPPPNSSAGNPGNLVPRGRFRTPLAAFRPIEDVVPQEETPASFSVVILHAMMRTEMPTNLRQWRRQNNLTQVGAATLLGVSQPYLSLLEKGVRPLNRELRDRLRLVRGRRNAISRDDQ